MNTSKNLFRRALDAFVDGRTRQDKRHLARYERDHPSTDYKFTGR